MGEEKLGIQSERAQPPRPGLIQSVEMDHSLREGRGRQDESGVLVADEASLTTSTSRLDDRRHRILYVSPVMIRG